MSECKLEKFEVVYCFQAWMRIEMRMRMRSGEMKREGEIESREEKKMDFKCAEARFVGGLGLPGGRAKFALESAVLLGASYHRSCRN